MRRSLMTVMMGAVAALASPPAWSQPTEGAEPAPIGPAERLSIRAVAIYDIRIGHIGTPVNDRKSQFQLLTRLEGSAISDVTRLGFPVYQEYKTDSGEDLVEYDKMKGREEQTHPYSRPEMTRRADHIDLPLEADVLPSRQATKLTRVAGYVWVVLGGPVEPVWFPHAKRFEGGYLEHPQLEQLGVKIRMLTLAEAPEIADGKSFAIVIESGEEYIRNIAAYDPWLRNTRMQGRQHTRDGKTYTVMTVLGQNFTEDWELGVYLFLKPEKVKVPIDFKDLELP